MSYHQVDVLRKFIFCPGHYCQGIGTCQGLVFLFITFKAALLLFIPSFARRSHPTFEDDCRSKVLDLLVQLFDLLLPFKHSQILRSRRLPFLGTYHATRLLELQSALLFHVIGPVRENEGQVIFEIFQVESEL